MAARCCSSTDSSFDVYRYDLASDTLTQVSARAGGTGNGAFDATTPAIAPGGFPNQLPRSLSADGHRAFFDTAEPLLPEDLNDQPDVYECTTARSGWSRRGRPATRRRSRGSVRTGVTRSS